MCGQDDHPHVNTRPSRPLKSLTEKGEPMTNTSSIIAPYGGYRKTLSFGMTCLIYHATTTFCRRNYNYKNDPLGKTSGQMIGAARSARQNLIEASSRAGTSSGTELDLLDVAKASLQELAGDYEAFLLDRGEVPWPDGEKRAEEFRALRFDPFEPGTGNVRHNYGNHFLRMRKRFAPILEAEDPVIAANGILLAIDKASVFLRRQMERNEAFFTEKGGFSERINKARIAARDAKKNPSQATNEEAPQCPKCGAAMVKRLAKKGRNAGNAFWSCPHWPECEGTRPC